MAQIVLNVPDISCGGCVQHVTKALTPIKGVQQVNVDLHTKRVSVEYDSSQVDVEQMKEVLAEEDYPVASVEAVS